MNGYSLSTKRKVFIAISKKELNLKNKQYYKWVGSFWPKGGTLAWVERF